jgi:hypothetical protein
MIERIRKSSHSNGIMDNINNVTFSDSFIAQYSYAGIRAGAFFSAVPASPAAPNTDLAGQCTLPCTYTFTQKYTSSLPPICTCSDTSAVHACQVQVTSTTLTITGTSGDTADYICIGRD